MNFIEYFQKKIIFRWRFLLSRLLLLLLSLGILIVLSELFLAFFYPIDYRRPSQSNSVDQWRDLVHQSSSIPGVDYELRPNLQKKVFRVVVRTNSLGMRDDEPVSPSNHSVHRIVVLGDSTTFGLYVPQESIYPLMLEKSLNEGTPDGFDVLNYGVSGYCTQDEVLVLKYKGLKWNPEMVIVGYVLNDPATGPSSNLRLHFYEPHWWQHFHLTRLIAKAGETWKINKYGQGNYYRYLHSDKGGQWEKCSKRFSANPGNDDRPGNSSPGCSLSKSC